MRFGWFRKSDGTWSEWSKPAYSGGGDYVQVRFRKSDNKMEKREIFMNISEADMNAAWKVARAEPRPLDEGGENA